MAKQQFQISDKKLPVSSPRRNRARTPGKSESPRFRRRFVSAAAWAGALPWIEWILFGIACLILLGLHVVLYRHAGAFWRDETSTILVAQRPTLSDLWSWLDADSCPALAPVSLRLWIGSGLGATEAGLRFFGLVVSAALVIALVLCCRAVVESNRPPLLAVALAAFNTSIFYYASSVRPYGLACVLIVVCFAAFWRMVRRPGFGNVAAASCAALLSVHVNYQNTYLLFGIGTAATTVCALSGLWKRALGVLAICFAAALSMLVYLPTIRAYRLATSIAFDDVRAIDLWNAIRQATALSIPVLWSTWVLLFILSVVFLTVRWVRQQRSQALRREPSLPLYGLLTLMIAGAAGFGFLRYNSMVPWPWHFTPFIALAAGVIEIAWQPSGASFRFAPVKLAMVVLILAASLFPLWQFAHSRRTNMDLLCEVLESEAKPDDLIIVNPMWLSPAFHYYYRGAAPWITLPEMPTDEKSRVSCYRPYRELMQTRDPLSPTLRRIGQTLAAGRRLWFVTDTRTWPRGNPDLPNLSPAPDPQFGWSLVVYYETWTMLTSRFLERHARRAEEVAIPFPAEHTLDPMEACRLLQFEGWVDEQAAPKPPLP